MNMYIEFLHSALEIPAGSEDTSTTGEALAQLLRCRANLGRIAKSPDNSSWAHAALADELAYDAALIRLARLFGIPVELRAFTQLSEERLHLEQGLQARGIRLEELDHLAPDRADDQ